MPGVEQLFTATFHDSPIGMAVLDAAGSYIDVNAAFTALVEYEREELLGNSFTFLTHPEDVARDIELLSQLTQRDFPYYQTQKRYTTKSGETVWVRATVVGVHASDGGELSNVVVQIEDVTEARSARAQLEERAFYDSLTGLANRELLIEHIKAAISSHEDTNTSIALVFLDLDHFKLVNDSLGHDAGDHLLAVIAQRLQSAVRRGDTVARLGGDEFVVLLTGLANEKEAEERAAIITKGAQRPVSLSQHEVIPTLSAGVAFVDEVINAETLLRDADTAMYAAKQSGLSGITIYDKALRDEVSSRLEIEEELREALREGELRVHYQPVVDLQQLRIVGYEALVRWQHPKRGLLAPADFIAVAIQGGLIVPIGKFVVRQACNLLLNNPNFLGQIYINVSPRQVGPASMATVISKALRDSEVDPKRLCVEITEAGVLSANRIAREDIDAIAALGVDLAIDDFGTSYAALSSLVRHPISRIKLAIEFAARLGDDGFGDRFSMAAAGLTRALGVTGIIEGIESNQQFARARVHGWQLAQGFLFGTPVAEDQIDFEKIVLDLPPEAIHTE